MKSENKLRGASNFRAWKTRIDLILVNNKVFDIENGKAVEPIDNLGKEKFKEYNITTMSLIVDSIRDHLIPYIPELKSLKTMYDALTKLFIVNKIG